MQHPKKRAYKPRASLKESHLVTDHGAAARLRKREGSPRARSGRDSDSGSRGHPFRSMGCFAWSQDSHGVDVMVVDGGASSEERFSSSETAVFVRYSMCVLRWPG